MFPLRALLALLLTLLPLTSARSKSTCTYRQTVGDSRDYALCVRDIPRGTCSANSAKFTQRLSRASRLCAPFGTWGCPTKKDYDGFYAIVSLCSPDLVQRALNQAMGTKDIVCKQGNEVDECPDV